VEEQPQEHLDRQTDHGEEEGHHDRILQQAHALEILLHFSAEERINRTAADQIKSAYHEHPAAPSGLMLENDPRPSSWEGVLGRGKRGKDGNRHSAAPSGLMLESNPAFSLGGW